MELGIVDRRLALHVDLRLFFAAPFNEPYHHSDGKTDCQRLHHRGNGIVFDVIQEACISWTFVWFVWFVGCHGVHRSQFEVSRGFCAPLPFSAC